MKAKQGAALAAEVWAPSNWRRDHKPTKAIRQHRHQIRCAAGPHHRAAIRKRWTADRAAFYKHRRAMLWRARVTPFYGGGHWWAIPYWHVVCESGADYHIGYAGAYGLITPTWLSYGGGAYASSAGEASPREQDLIAHKVWIDNGDAAWTPFEGGCT